MASPTVSSDRGPQVGEVHPEVGVDQHLPRRAEPKGEGSLVQAGVAFSGHVHGEPRLTVEAFLPDVPPVGHGAPVAGYLEAVAVGIRSAAEKDAVAVVGGEPDELHEPANDRSLDVDRRVVTARAARVGHG